MLYAVAFPQPPPRGGGGLPYWSDRDTCRLALGCKLQILVSLSVFGMESHYICPFRYRLVLCIKKLMYKKHPDTNHAEISLRAQFKLEPHPHWSPLGVWFEFSDEHPRQFYMGAHIMRRYGVKFDWGIVFGGWILDPFYYVIWQHGEDGVTKWLERWNCNSEALSSSLTLTASWISSK